MRRAKDRRKYVHSLAQLGLLFAMEARGELPRGAALRKARRTKRLIGTLRRLPYRVRRR